MFVTGVPTAANQVELYTANGDATTNEANTARQIEAHEAAWRRGATCGGRKGRSYRNPCPRKGLAR